MQDQEASPGWSRPPSIRTTVRDRHGHRAPVTCWIGTSRRHRHRTPGGWRTSPMSERGAGSSMSPLCRRVSRGDRGLACGNDRTDAIWCRPRLRMGLWDRDRPDRTLEEPGLVHHSDAGSQYTSIQFAEHAGARGQSRPRSDHRRRVRQRPRWSRRSDCSRPSASATTASSDQAAAARLADVECVTIAWVDWYNHRRLHSTLGDVPPESSRPAITLTSTRHPNRRWHPPRSGKEPGTVQTPAGSANTRNCTNTPAASPPSKWVPGNTCPPSADSSESTPSKAATPPTTDTPATPSTDTTCPVNLQNGLWLRSPE